MKTRTYTHAYVYLFGFLFVCSLLLFFCLFVFLNKEKTVCKTLAIIDVAIEHYLAMSSTVP